MTEDFQSEYGATVLPALIKCLSDAVPRVSAHCASAITNFMDGAEEELVVVIGLSGDLVVGFVVAGLGVVASIALSRGRIVICVGSIWNVLSSILFECMNGMFVVYLV